MPDFTLSGFSYTYEEEGGVDRAELKTTNKDLRCPHCGTMVPAHHRHFCSHRRTKGGGHNWTRITEPI